MTAIIIMLSEAFSAQMVKVTPESVMCVLCCVSLRLLVVVSQSTVACHGLVFT